LHFVALGILAAGRCPHNASSSRPAFRTKYIPHDFEPDWETGWPL
jgi:hypothetical protein